jgi:hypothetical protein
MKRLRNWFGLRCWLRLCPHRYHDTSDGCGGKCVDCGHLAGWLTNEELRAVADRALERDQ